MIKITAPKADGLRITAYHLDALLTGLKELIKPSRLTIHYPLEKRWVNDRFRGFIINDMEKCISCFQCAWACPVNAIWMYRASNGKFYPGIRYEQCILCHFCVDACPVGSLQGTTIHDVAFADLDSTVFEPEDMAKPPNVVDESKYIIKYEIENGNLIMKKIPRGSQ